MLRWLRQRGGPLTLAVAVGILSTLGASCSKQHQDRAPVFPVKGKVLVDGRPANGAAVTFYRAGVAITTQDKGSAGATARTKEDGSFTMATYEPDDGLPAGDYDVAIHLKQGRESSRRTEKKPDLLHDRYSDPKTSGLKARVEEKPNELPPFNLTSQ